MQIYIGRGGQREGPFTIDEVRARVAQGQAQLDDLAWYEGAPNWIPLREVPNLTPPVAAAIPPAIPGPPPVPRQPAGVPTTIAAQPPQEGLAVASLILGIVGLTVIPFLASIPGVVCGHMALGRIKRSAGALGGRGLAIGGLVTGYLAIAGFLLVMLLVAALLPAVVKNMGSIKKQFAPEISVVAGVAGAKNIHDACVAYAAANDGKFPPSLEALLPRYLSNAGALAVTVGANDERPGFQYFGGTTSDDGNRVLFQSWGALPNRRRVVAYVDGRIEVEERPETISLEQPAPAENSSKEQ